MRTIIFLFLVICLGTSSQAQNKLSVSKVKTISMPMAQTTYQTDIISQSPQTAARFFKVKNARVKQALLFKARFTKTQIA